MNRRRAPVVPGTVSTRDGVAPVVRPPQPAGLLEKGSGTSTPLTERILLRLPGHRARWLVAWGLVPWLNLGLLVATGSPGWSGDRVPVVEVLNRVAVTFAVLLSLWGAARIADELGRLQRELAEAVEQEEPDVAWIFRGVDSVLAPLLLLVAVGVVLPMDEALRGEPLAALIQAGTWVVIGIPLCTAVWVYLTLQLGLTRLSRGRLTLQGYHGDRTLGLQPVGRLAFTGFWLLFGAVGPLVLTGFSDLPTVVVGAVVLLVGVVLFFLSLRGLHQRMLAIRQNELDRALSLYEEAYREVQRAPTLEVLQRQAGLLGAAEALEKRVERIQSWPFDEATFARVVTIASSVAAVIIARLILAPTGL